MNYKPKVISHEIEVQRTPLNFLFFLSINFENRILVFSSSNYSKPRLYL